jgi:peptide/nickel transport system substrate-binding protein
MKESQVLSRRRLLQGVAAGAAMSAPWITAASARQDQDAPETFTLVTNRTPSDLDPHAAYDAGSGLALQGPFEGLIRLASGATDDYQPLLAESWFANEDRSVWTFRLREGVRFQDGTPLDAEAARASFERLLRLDLAPATVLGRFIADPAQIAAPDARTLVFDLDRPQPRFEAAIAAPYGTAIVNVAALRQHEVDGDFGHAWAQTNSEGLGTGPYRIADFDIENGVVLERHDAYWGGWERGHFARVIIRIVVEPETRRALLENGEADLAIPLPLAAVRDLERHPELVVDRRYNLAVNYLAMTVAGPLQTPEARQAMCWAFPYREVIDGVYEGFAKRAIGPVAELCRGFAPETFVYETDLARARSLFQAAGVAEGTALHVMFPAGNQETVAIAELLQANLAEVGIGLDIELTDFATYVGIAFGDLPSDERPHLFPAFWQPDYNDAWSHLWPQVSCDAWRTGNVGHYCNERVEALLAAARDASDELSYLDALRDVQQIVTRDDPAAIYVAQPQWLTVLRRDVGGFVPNLVVGEIVAFHDLFRQSPG